MLQHETWPIDKLIEYARNPRKNDHAVDRVAAAIREFGFRVPVVAKSDGTVVDGHLRLKAAKKLGLTEVPVVLADDMTDLQIKAFRLSVNKMAELAEWDDELLAIEFAELADAGFDNLLTGFTQDEIDALTPEQIPEGLTDEDAVPELQAEPVSKLGDVWVLGKHRVMCGDSTSIDAVERLMDGRKANMLHTDPPYGVDYEGVPNDHLKDVQLEAFLHDALSCAFTALAPGSNIYVWHADITALEFISAFRSAGFKQARPSTIQWVKPSLTMSQGDYHLQNEPCLYGWKEGSGRVRVKDRKQTTIWKCDRTDEAKVHPTMKPVELCQRAIENSSEVNGIVLDLFGGSGSTLIACEKTARDCRMMELEPKYCDVIVRRWQEFTGKQATHEATGATFAEVEADSALAIAEDV